MTIKLDWVLSNEIAIGSAPKTFEDINYLKVNGIHGILSLCSMEENPFNVNLKDFFNCKNIILPDYKYKYSLSIDQLNLALENLSILRNLSHAYAYSSDFKNAEITIKKIINIEKLPKSNFLI